MATARTAIRRTIAMAVSRNLLLWLEGATPTLLNSLRDHKNEITSS